MTTGRPLVRRILVVNLHSARNVGDAMLTDATVSQLRGAFPEATITLAMNQPDYVPAAPGVQVMPSLISDARPYHEADGDRWRHSILVITTLEVLLDMLCARLIGRAWPWHRRSVRQLLQEYRGADLVLSCAGNVFFTMGRVGMPFLAAALTAACAHGFRKPLYVLPQTVGPLERAWERRVVRALYSRARLVFVRDRRSAELLGHMGLHNVRVVPDLSFSRGDEAAAAAQSHVLPGLATAARPLLGVTVINRILRRIPDDTYGAYERAVADTVASFLATHGGTAVFFPQVTGPGRREDDRVATERVIAMMPEGREHTIFVDEVLPPERLRAAYAVADVFLATRMHSAILALTSCVPTLAIEYLAKTEGMMSMMGLGEWVLSLSALDGDVLGRRLEALYERRQEVRDHLAQVVPEVARRAGGVGQAIAEDMG